MQRAFAPALCLGLLFAAACGGSTPDAATLLKLAKQSVDTAQSAHFTLSSSQVQGSGPFITGGSGDMRRPASFSGSLDVDFSGLQVTIGVVSVGGVFYAQLPTAPGYQRTDPAAYGFADPSTFLDPNNGLTKLLTLCQQPSLGSDDRNNGELLHEVSCNIPGSAVASLLTDASPSQPVSATFGVAASNNQLRKVVLNGPFYKGSGNTTFTLVIDRYGENVSITPPPAAT
ncbi:MAG TPA: LppX_LprAFG lipoprotein [Candidatus Dormibacteraeota bacterium]|nr:LppX_LprAFG lipoprotein [Candidatus Dormibacteraeota bacterium]